MDSWHAIALEIDLKATKILRDIHCLWLQPGSQRLTKLLTNLPSVSDLK